MSSHNPWSAPPSDNYSDQPPIVSAEIRGGSPTSLLVSGALMIMIGVLGGLDCLYVMLIAEPITPPLNPEPGFKTWQALSESLRSPISLALSVTMVVGGISMVRRQVFPGAVIGSLAALAPCTTTLCVSVPLGAWCLYLLHRPGMQDVFTNPYTPQTPANEPK